jgi:AraC-like DNA-binding protein
MPPKPARHDGRAHADRPQQPISPHSFYVESSDLAEVRISGQRFLPFVSIDPLESASHGVVRLAWTTLGAVTIADTFNSASLRVRVDELESSYYVALPVTGHSESHQAGTVINSSPPRARVFLPVGEIVLMRSSNCRILGLRVDRLALESQLAALVERPVRSPLKLAPAMDVSAGAGRGWARLMRLLVDEAQRDGLLHQPLMAERLSDTVLTWLLLAADHPYRDLLARPPPLRRSRPVRRAIDAIHAHPEQPFSATQLAEVAGVAVRTLQEGFRRHVGMSPMAYLQQVRLHQVHQELSHANPQEVTVADVAFRWGFSHLGRFAAIYRARYGTTPSQTLRNAT